MSRGCQSCWVFHTTAKEKCSHTCTFTHTQRERDITSFNRGYCCHRQCFLPLPLYSLGTSIGIFCVEADNGRNGSLRHSLVSLLISSIFPLHNLSALSVILSPFPAQISHSLTFMPIPHQLKWQCTFLSRPAFSHPFSLELRWLCHVSHPSALRGDLFNARSWSSVGDETTVDCGSVGRPLWLVLRTVLAYWAGCVFCGFFRFTQFSMKTAWPPHPSPHPSKRSACSLW